MKKELSRGIGFPFFVLDNDEVSGSGLLLGACW